MSTLLPSNLLLQQQCHLFCDHRTRQTTHQCTYDLDTIILTNILLVLLTDIILSILMKYLGFKLPSWMAKHRHSRRLSLEEAEEAEEAVEDEEFIELEEAEQFEDTQERPPVAMYHHRHLMRQLRAAYDVRELTGRARAHMLAIIRREPWRFPDMNWYRDIAFVGLVPAVVQGVRQDGLDLIVLHRDDVWREWLLWEVDMEWVIWAEAVWVEDFVCRVVMGKGWVYWWGIWDGEPDAFGGVCVVESRSLNWLL